MPGSPVVLDQFGGIVATARPEDLPEGASPRNNDVDFVVSRFIQRPGAQNVYSIVLNQFGPEGGSVASDINTEGMPWTNPNNILLNDGVYTTINLLGEIGVTAVNITQGGYYALTETPILVFTGTGTPATGTVVTATITPTSGPQYKTVTGVTGLTPGAYTSAVTVSFTGAADSANNATATLTTSNLGHISDNLRVTGFPFTVPSNYVIRGITCEIKGFASNATVYARLVKAGSLIGNTNSHALPTIDGFVTLGGQTDLWGTTWLYTDIDSPNFGLELWTDSTVATTVSLDYVQIRIYGSPTPANFNGVVSANLDQKDETAIYLDANGLSWREDITNAPQELQLESDIPQAVAGSYLKGLDANGVAYMAYSDLTQGTSQPMQWNGRWCDRITQVGPGQSPVFTPQQSTSDTFAISTIDQPAQATYGFIYYLQSSGPGSTAPGNVVTIYYGDSTQPNPVNTDLVAAWNTGFPVYLYLSITGTPTTFGPETIQVTSIGLQSPPSQPRQFYFFTFVVPNSAFLYYQGSGHGAYTSTWTRTLATMQMAVSVPGLEVGNVVTIAANSQAGYNSAWTIAQTLDSGAMAITSTSVTAGVATYNYALQTGVAPAAGELVTVTATTNANGQLNVTNAVIVTSTGGSTGSFTVNVPIATDYASTPESAQATTAGTLFAFDPGFPVLGTGTNPIHGLGTGGTLTFQGAAAQLITAGVKQGTVFFITRNGAVTCLAPPAEFTVPSNCGAILATQIPLGPPNVIARGIAFTESGQNGVAGANFYTYDKPVTFIVNGVTYTSSALIVPDNTTTSMKFSFSDAVLLSSDEIDIPGHNYFNLIEIGSPTWLFQYANRMMYGLCQTKIQNFLNPTFDGGYLPTYSSALPMPTAWTPNTTGNNGSYTITAFQITSNVVTVTAANSLEPGYSVIISGLSTGTYLNGLTFIVQTASPTQFTVDFSHADVALTADSGVANVNSSGFGIVPSLDFGNAFRMVNYGAANWTDNTILFQGAYQDAYDAPIIEQNVPYSIRVKARSINHDAQQLTVQFLTYSGGVFSTENFGAVNMSFNQGGYVIQTAPIITGNGLATVPPTLVIALGINALIPSAGLEVDRIEVFPTNRPVDTTTIWTSYAGNFEAVDVVTGQLGVGGENPQPATGAMEILEQLYVQKTRSLLVTQDSPNYEPNNWQVRQSSDRAGAVGPNAFDEGEEFAISASRNGVYFFDGGKPMPVSRELQSTGSSLNLWETINWAAGDKIWVRNDLQNRRLHVGIPMVTPNFWLPNAPALTPTSPNVILMCNYTGCPTGEDLAQADAVHVTMFGDLKNLDMRRKWSLWQIKCPVAEFVPRNDTLTNTLFLCNGISSGKVYQLINGAASGGQNTDDGTAINWQYTTYAFVKAKQGQQTGLGALRKVWYYLAATMEGVGQVAGKLYSNSLGALARNTFTIPLPFTLSSPQQNDQERVLEIGGQRVFVEFSSIGTGGYAEVGPVMLDGEVDKNSPHRGVAS